MFNGHHPVQASSKSSNHARWSSSAADRANNCTALCRSVNRPFPTPTPTRWMLSPATPHQPRRLGPAQGMAAATSL
jgi:hypothetical protein